jgi:hypothetical protein
VGEIDQPEDSVDEREADRPERVDRSVDEAVEGGLGDVVESLGGDQGQHHDRDHSERDRGRMLSGQRAKALAGGDLHPSR